MNRALKILLPVVVLALGLAGAVTLILSREIPESGIPARPLPLVRVETVELRDLQLSVRSQGTVTPRTESTLVSEVAGRVIAESPSFVAGGFFEAEDVLLRVDPEDYEQALVRARSELAQAELRLAQERAEADVARREWQDLGGGEASPLTLREPQVAQAEAGLAAARAAVRRAERDLERTNIRAPYAGRVREKLVGVGQYVAPGTRLAAVYAVDYAEVRLPLPNQDLAFVDLPLDYRGEDRDARGPEVVLRADFAGGTHTWRGRIVRTEGEIDPRTRMVHAVARVRDPYARGDDPDRPPLAAGLFVEAEILGRRVDGVAVIPRAALRNGDRVLVVDDQDRLRFRDVDVLRRTDADAVVRAGLAPGDRVCLTVLSAVTDGMQVRVADDGSAQTPPAGAET